MIENWPPAKGPKPKHLDVSLVYQEVAPKRADFSFKLPMRYRKERRAILMAILDYKEGQKFQEKVGWSMFGDDGCDELRGESVKVGERLSLAHHIGTVAGLTAMQASRMIYGASKAAPTVSEMKPAPVKVKITYPLSRGVSLTVRPFILVRRYRDGNVSTAERRMTVGYVLWTIAQEYRRIYADWKRYGVWGYALEDLHFEGFKVKRGAEVEVVVGSR